MSTSPGLPTPGHAAYDELVAGYALDALEPGDETALLAHLPSCVRCLTNLRRHREVAAELALAFAETDTGLDPVDGVQLGVEPGPAVPVSAALAEAMRSRPAEPVAEPLGEELGIPAQPVVVTLPRVSPVRAQLPAQRRGAGSTARRVLVGAGALGIVAAVSLSAYDVHLRRETPATGQSAALRALADPQATIAHLAGAQASATAVVAEGHTWLVTNGLAPTTGTASYVVWNVAGAKPVAIADFHEASSSAPEVADLGSEPRMTVRYVVTREPDAGGELPAVAHGPTVLSQTAG